MAIGSLTLTPSFDPNKTSYTVTTTNNTNTVSAVTTSETATLTIEVNGVEHENGTSATWQTGENTVVITLEESGYSPHIYTVVVTKE